MYGVEIVHERILAPWSWYLDGRESKYLLDDLVRVFEGFGGCLMVLDTLEYCCVQLYEQ